MQRLASRLFAAVLTTIALGIVAGPAGAEPYDMTLGNPKAKVTVVEYASVACPVCGRWYRDVYPAFKAKYIDAGAINFVSREMLVGDRDEIATATMGFLLARCAGPGKYFAVTGAIYHSQPNPDLANPPEPNLYSAPRETLLGIAKSVGIDERRFDACVGDSAAIIALNQRVDGYAARNHVNSTPTFVINGKMMEPGYHSLAQLDQAIAAAQAAK